MEIAAGRPISRASTIEMLQHAHQQLAPLAAEPSRPVASDLLGRQLLACPQVRRPSRVSRSACERRSVRDGSRRVRPRRSSLSNNRTSRARSIPSRSARSDCDSPGLAAITTRTEYCAGLMSIGASVDEILEHPDLQAPDEIA
jgi:hypothetical protein